MFISVAIAGWELAFSDHKSLKARLMLLANIAENCAEEPKLAGKAGGKSTISTGNKAA